MAEQEGGQAHGNVDQEDPAPGQILRQRATEDRRRAGRHQDRHDQRARDLGPALGPVGAVEHRRAGWGEHAAAHSLQRTGGDQCGQALGGPHSAEATVNTTSANRKVRFVPTRSPIQPEAGITTARVSR